MNNYLPPQKDLDVLSIKRRYKQEIATQVLTGLYTFTLAHLEHLFKQITKKETCKNFESFLVVVCL